MQGKALFYSFARKHTWVFFVVPAVLVLLSLVIFPMLFSLTLSFHDWNAIRAKEWKWAGLNNYKTILFEDPYFRTSAKVTVLY